MLTHAFKRDITSRHNESTNKCQPVFAVIAGFRREGARGREKLKQGKKNEGGGKSRVANTCLPELCARTVWLHSASNSVGYRDKYQL